MNISFLEENTLSHKSFLKVFQELKGRHDIFRFNYNEEDINILHFIKPIYEKVVNILELKSLPVTDVFLIKADGDQDGHAISLDDKIVTFLDLEAYRYHLKRPSFDAFSHLLHEMVHGSHYSLNSSFEPGNLSHQDMLKAKSIVEGLCVFVSSEVNPLGENYWFNFLNNDELKRWIDNCKKNYEKDLDSLRSSIYSEEQKTNLLSLSSFEAKDLVLGRRAYYCMSKFFSSLEMTIEEILVMNMEDIETRLMNY